MSQLFDPLGLINPIVVKAKIFMQDLWILKLNWDESLPIHLHSAWTLYKEQLNHLKQLRIPRHVLPLVNTKQIEIHGFADASERAYGCCLYIRSANDSEAVAVNLLSAKSRVAPVKSQSLPRLELCAAVLLVELLQKILNNLSHPVDKIYLWTDSEVVLDWLSVHPSTWTTFVANRVSRIQELSTSASWRHVNSKANPADVISRGATVEQLLKSIWYSGPDFLYKTEELWPKTNNRKVGNNIAEKRATKVSLLATVSPNFAALYTNRSDFMRTCRVFAYVLRFVRRCQKKTYTTIVGRDPSAQEVDRSFMRIVYNIQQLAFADEINALNKGNQISPKSNIKKRNPFLDVHSEVKLLRVGGRLQNANIPYETKCPILLPKNNPFVKSYINHLHFRNYHAGSQALVAIVRQKFWIINARVVCRSIVQKCLHCFKYRSKLKEQIMGHFPAARVNIARPFLNCGVDFCGPIYTIHKIRGKGPYKSYIAIFVWLVTKAAHLEVVSDLTSDAFIAALKQFVARRGLYQHLYCDNGTNFVGARRELAEFREKFLQQQTQGKIASWCASHDIQFHHIPPRSPYFGGLWEATVKSAKGHFYRSLGNTLLTFEELTTTMAEIEAILNSRPISALSTDPNDLEVLTPGHFLIGAPMNCIAEPNMEVEENKWSFLQRWHRLRSIQQHFWQRWSREYLLELQRRYKWSASSKDVQTGTLVLIDEDNVPSQQWLIGRVVNVCRSKDGHVRVVDIKTKNGVFKRPIHRLAPLPVDE